MRAFALVPTLLLSALASDLPAADLRLQVEGVRSAQGHLLVSVIADAAGWDGQGEPAARSRQPARAGSMQFDFTDLAPGTYAIQILHDGNDNGRLDTNVMGMPVEGYGFSNNPQVMRKATFDEAAIELPADGTTVTVTLN